VSADETTIKAVFFAALERASPAERSAYLDGACAGDADLRREVEVLLRAHGRPDPLLDQPAAQLLAAEDGADLDFLGPSAKPGSLGRLGHYEVLGVVGRGGMGVVLRAFDEKLHRVVAIKALAPVLAAGGPSRQRFVREARATAAVTHDNVIAIHAVEDAGPVPYLVMQFVHGCTLQEKLDRAGPLPVPEVLRLGIGIADGLAAAHRHGLVHRDVKPANILLENGVERVKITDFGLARAADDASLTRSGVIAGTPAYMSPEQASGDRLDPRSDLFSLGSVLYALCTGHPPFRAGSAMAVLRRVCDDTPRPICEINPAVPEWLAAVVAKLQAKGPGQRFASAAEVAALLSRRLTQLQTGAEVSDPGSQAARPAGPRPGPGKRLLTAGRLAAAVAVVGVVLAGWLTRGWWLPAPPPVAADPAPVAAPPEPWRPRPPLSADELAKLPDPLDGWRRDRLPTGLLASVAGDAKDGLPALVGVLGDGPFRLPRQEHTHWPTQTADGRLLALPCGNTVVLYDAATGAIVRVLKGHKDATFVGDFTPDGKRFACGAVNGAIRVWDVATGKEELSFQDGANEVWGTLFSPDGKQLVTVSNQGAVKVWNAAEGKAPKTLGQPVAHKGGATCLAFNAAGTRLATAGLDCRVRVWDWPGGELLQTLEGHPDKIQDLAFSADGALLASGSQSRVVVWDVATLRPRHTLETAGGGLLGFTPDGRTLVAGPHEFPAGQKRAFTRWDVETGALSATRDVPGPRNVMVGRLSRDGRTVYLMSYMPPEARLGAYDAVTGADRFADPGHAGPVFAVAFSPDGRTLASGGGEGRVCLWDLATPPGGAPAPPRRLTGHDHPVNAVTFSPDGRLLASGSIDGTIRLSDAATGRRVVPDLPTAPAPILVSLAFSPDGETLAAGGENGGANLWAVKTGQPKEPVRWHRGFVHAVAFSPDGRWLASGGLDSSVQFIDRASGRRVHTLRLRTPITGLAFSPDSQTLAAASDGPGPPVRLWDVATRAERALTGETGPVLGLAFDPQGRRIATGSPEGAARLWDTSPGADRPRVFDFRHTGRAVAVAFSPSGRHLAVGLGNGLIAILRTPPDPAR
jgi:WD40 repeat protein/serine/threonine protein kinase